MIPINMFEENHHIQHGIHLARRAAANSYSPYSNLAVGCALTGEEANNWYVGTNIENASYGLTMCAERSAIFACVSNNRVPEQLIVTCPLICSCDEIIPEEMVPLVMPCGACRQVMVEFMKPETMIIVDRVGGFTLGELLCCPFKLDSFNNDLPFGDKYII